MDHLLDIEAIRRKAVGWLQDVLDKAAVKSSNQTANCIVELTTKDANPFRDLILATSSNYRTPTASSAATLKSKSSRGLLRLTRRETKSGRSESKAATSASQADDPQILSNLSEILGNFSGPTTLKTDEMNKDGSSKSTIAGGTNNGKAAMKAVPNVSSFPASEKTTKAQSSAQYICIICQDKKLSSKGVCRRHLEDQHVWLKSFKCDKCQERFYSKAEAKKHCNPCGRGVFWYTTMKLEKKIYACEYTGQYFQSMSKYVDHLLLLCERRDARPQPSFHRKLCALLDQPELRQHVAEISMKKYQSRHAWKNLRWADAHLLKAIEQLELAALDDKGQIEFGKNEDGPRKTQNARVYLNGLLSAGSLSSPGSSTPVAQNSEGRSGSGTQTRRQSASYDTDNGSATPTVIGKHAPLASYNNASATPAWDASFSTVVPESTDSGDSALALAAEVKAKRHLSENSRSQVPTRLPPGPPTTPNFSYPPFAPVQPQHSMTPNTSIASLPIRTQEGSAPVEPHGGSLNLQPSLRDAATIATPTLSSDAVSESTLVSSYQEPQLLNIAPFGNDYWPTYQNVNNFLCPFDTDVDYGVSNSMYYYPTEASVRASSAATEQTYVTDDYNENEHKHATFDQFHPYPIDQGGRTFFLDGDDYHDFNSMS